MHLFQWNILLYLSFHLVGGMFCFISIIGIPGNPDESKPMVKKISNIFNILFHLCWTGIPTFFILSVCAFYFEWNLIGKILSTLSMSLGLALFFSLVTLYNIKD